MRLIAPYELPPPYTKRWTNYRKEIVVLAIEQGILSLSEARERYWLSIEEFLEWRALYSSFGVKALKTCQLQRYRTSCHVDQSPRNERERHPL